MAGHSHFANIRRKKDANDAKKAKLYTLLNREIRITIGDDPNPDSNPRLKNAIAKAKSMGLPKENIERALKSKSKDDDIFENIVYEAYWNNIAIIIVTQTNNRLRTGPEIKNILTKASATQAEIGSALFLFENIGICTIKKNKILCDSSKIEEYTLLECNASNYHEYDNPENDEDSFIEVHFPINEYKNGSENLIDFLSKHSKSDNFIEENILGYNPISKIELSNKEKIESFEKLINNLEDLDDVINVFHNADIKEEC